MVISKNYSVSESELVRLNSLTSEDLKAHISSLNLFSGLYIEVVKQKEKEVYAEIKSWKTKETASKVAAKKVTKRDGEDNTSRQANSPKKKGRTKNR